MSSTDADVLVPRSAGRPYKCFVSHCGHTFVDKTMFSKHRQTLCGINMTRVCHHCGLNFRLTTGFNAQTYRRHLKLHDTNRFQPHTGTQRLVSEAYPGDLVDFQAVESARKKQLELPGYKWLAAASTDPTNPGKLEHDMKSEMLAFLHNRQLCPAVITDDHTRDFKEDLSLLKANKALFMLYDVVVHFLEESELGLDEEPDFLLELLAGFYNPGDAKQHLDENRRYAHPVANRAGHYAKDDKNDEQQSSADDDIEMADVPDVQLADARTMRRTQRASKKEENMTFGATTNDNDEEELPSDDEDMDDAPEDSESGDGDDHAGSNAQNDGDEAKELDVDEMGGSDDDDEAGESDDDGAGELDVDGVGKHRNSTPVLPAKKKSRETSPPWMLHEKVDNATIMTSDGRRASARPRRKPASGS